MMISLKNVSKKYKGRNFELTALKDIDINIAESEFVAIVGKSGSGKSTLIKIIGLLDNDFQGEYSFNGESIRDCNDNQLTLMRRSIGFIFQDFQLIPRYNVYKNVELSYAIKYKKIDKKKILETIKSMGLIDKINSYPDELSGGQKQRVSIARALVTDPQLIIADEPTGALDESTAQEILDIIMDINKRGTTVIFVTHDNDIAKKAHRILKLKNGEIIV